MPFVCSVWYPVRWRASLRGAADELLDRTIDGTVGPLVLHIVRNSDLSEADLQELRAMLEEKELRGDAN